MPIISTARLETLGGSLNRNVKKSGKGSNKSYLMYPTNMKNDDVIEGQDRIEFSIKEYKLKSDKLKAPRVGPAENLNIDTPFPQAKNAMKESEFYVNSSLKMGGNSVEKVFLPIQDKIQDTNAVTWADGGQLNDIQRRVANLSYNAMKGGEGLQMDKSLEAMTSLLTDKSIGDLGRLALVEQIIGVQGLFTRATGKILNPNLELLFNTPTLRPFTFNFKLSPRDQNEADEVKRIIRFFKQGMAPRVQENSLFVKSPYVFGIKYLMGSSKTHTGIGKVKTCALQNCTVDYTPNNSYMTYKDGTMVAYNVNMTFQEILPVYASDYDEDDHPIGY